ncbi:hypothetical protein ABZP36_018886 [Zizania latifolia]
MAAITIKLAVAVTCTLLLASACNGLEVGYYRTTCPRVETIVRAEVKKFVYKNSGIGAGLIRLLFHDCFVEVHIGFANFLRRRCPANPTTAHDPTVNQDPITPNAFDNQYYHNILAHKVLFTSDAALLTSPETAKMVVDNANIPGWWEDRFKKAFVKMAAMDVKTGYQGEIRKNCRVVN